MARQVAGGATLGERLWAAAVWTFVGFFIVNLFIVLNVINVIYSKLFMICVN